VEWFLDLAQDFDSQEVEREEEEGGHPQVVVEEDGEKIPMVLLKCLS
jgi:hypothetical protein